MDESFMFGWSTNTFDQLQDPNFQTNQSPFLDEIIQLEPASKIGYTSCTVTSNNDPFGFLQGRSNEQLWTNDCNSNNNSYNFCANPLLKDCSGDLNLISDGLVERHEAFGSSKRRLQQSKMVSLQNRDHIIAERKRREKLNQRFIELSSIIPYLKKSDKSSILVEAVKYVKELQAKVKTLESQNPKPIDTVVLLKSSSHSSDDADYHSGSSSMKPLPEIHAKLSENSVLISIHCENHNGMLVKILSEIEELNFTITHTNLMPFAGCTALITITAQVEKSCCITMEDVVRKLDSTLHQFKSTKNGN